MGTFPGPRNARLTAGLLAVLIAITSLATVSPATAQTADSSATATAFTEQSIDSGPQSGLSSIPQPKKAPRSKVIKLTVTNPTSEPHPAEDIVINVAKIKHDVPDFNAAGVMVTTSNATSLDEDAQASQITELPSQADDLDGDGQPDELAFQIDLQPKQTRIVTLSYGDSATIAHMRSEYPPRTHAKFTMHYDGMGWESEVTAWRLYFDKRNAMDLWGKKKRGLYLEMFGATGYKYQEESPLARDIYNVGNSLGSGGVGAWVNGQVVRVADVTDRQWKIIATGPVRAIVEFTYKGWQVDGRSVDLTSRVTQWAGERGYAHHVTVNNLDGVTLVAGLSRKPDLKEFSAAPSCSIGIWGHQVVRAGTGATESLPDQNLGLALLAPHAPKNCEISSDPNNYLAKIPVKNGTAWWYVLAAWDQEETDRIATLEDFTRMVKAQSGRLEHPASVSVLPLPQPASAAAKATHESFRLSVAQHQRG